MQAQRQLNQNLVYWPVNNIIKFPVKMNNIANNEDLDGQQWKVYMSSVAEQKDRSAYKALYLHFAPKVKSFYLQQSTMAHAEEMTHEVFLRVWQKAASYQANKAQVSTWIFTIARNLKIDRLRKKQLVEVNDENQMDIADETNLEDSITLERNQIQFGALFKLLNEQQRNVIQKVYFEDKSHQATSDDLGLSLGEVKSRVRSALNILRSHMGGDEK